MRSVRDKNGLSNQIPHTASEPFGAIPTREPRRAAAWSWSSAWLGARVVGALALLATGAVHLQQYLKLYSAIPTIGTLFVLNFAGATAIGLALLAPLERIGGRHGRALVVLAAAGGIAIAAVAFVFLLISEQTPLFGFKEPGYDPTAIAAARAAEVATVVFLGGFLVGRLALKSPMRRW
jgi:hypothetical protein